MSEDPTSLENDGAGARPLSDLVTTDEMAWALVEASPDALVIANHDGVVELVNRQAEVLFGYDRVEMLGRPIETLLPPEFEAAHRAHRTRHRVIPEVRAMGEGLELWARRADGRDIPVEISLSPIELDGRTLVLAAVREISKQQADAAAMAEAAVQASEARFHAAFHEGPVPMVIVEVKPPDQHTIVDMNQALAGLFGYTSDELIGQPAARLMHPDDVRRNAPQAQAIAAGDDIDYQRLIRGIRKDGTEIWLDRHVSALSPGVENKIIVHVIDVTARVEADQALRGQQALTKALAEIRLAMLQGATRDEGLTLLCETVAGLLDATGAVVLTPVDGDDEVVIEASFGVSKSVQRQMHFRSSVGAVGEVFQTGQPVHTPGVRHESTPSANRAVLAQQRVGPVIMAPLPSGEETVGVLAIIRRSDQKPFSDGDLAAAEEFAASGVVAIELAHARDNEAALHMLEDRERIAQDMHDNVISRLFSTGMKVQATTGRLTDPALRERLVSVVDDIDAAIKEIRTSIYGIRSRPDWGKGIRGAILALAADQKQILGFEPQVNLLGPIDDLPKPIVDALLAVIREALTNIAKYADAANVDLTITCSSSDLELKIKDNGAGFGVDCPTAENDHGGNGLRNIRDRAAALGGQATVNSEVGKGTLVTLTIPLPAEQT